MVTPLTLRTERRSDGTFVLIAAGELDISNVDPFNEALTECANTGETVTVDLSAVAYLDSSAINVLFAHADHIHLIVRPLLIRVLTVAGLTTLTTVQAAPPPHADAHPPNDSDNDD